VPSRGALDHDPYAQATVVKVDDYNIHLFRPYVHTSDTVFMGKQIIPYIGIEQFAIPVSSNKPLILVANKEVKG